MTNLDWGDIPNDLAIKIVENLEFHEDFTAFSAVCRRWRSAAKEAKFRACCIPTKLLPRDHRQILPYLMLPEPDDSSPCRRFSSLCHRRIHHLNLPPPPYTLRHPVIDTFNHEQRFLSSRGWLLIVKAEGGSIKLSLFNPFNGSIIELPTLEIYSLTQRGFVPFIHGVFYFQKFILSDDPSTTSDFSVALILEEPYLNLSHQFEIVAYWRNGDDHWVQLDMLENYLNLCSDVSFYRGEFYAVDEFGDVLAFQPGEDLPRLVTMLSDRGIFSSSFDDFGPYNYLNYKTHHRRTIFYLVESMGRLLLLCRVKRLIMTDDENGYYQTKSFDVFEVNVENREAKKVQDLGSRAVFVGTNSSFSVEAYPAHGCKANCIYFADDYRYLYFEPSRGRFDSRGKDSGLYNLATGEVERYYDGSLNVSDYGTPHMWLESLAP